MANTVRIKRRASGSPGAPSSLANAELAFNEVDSTLYYGVGTGGTGGSATTILAIGGPGSMATLSTAQTISGNKTFTGSVDLTGATATAATQLTSDNSTKVATTAYVKGQNYLTGNQNITVSGDASGSGTTSISLTLASVGTAGTYTKVTTDAKGRVTSGTTLSATDIPTLTASKISDFDTQVRTSRLDQMAAAGADVSHGGFKIINVADPVNAQDAATKNYVDSTAQGLDVKGSVKAATTANITLSGTQTIDGIALVVGDRCLVKNQTTTSQNGIYVVAASTWSRATDMDAWNEVPGGFTFVEQGSTLADTGWVCTSDQGGTLGTTAITFTQFSGAGTYTAGNGLNLSGNSFSATGTANRITVGAGGIDIASNYVGQNTITTLGTIGTGTWNGSVIGATYGGTGVNNGSNTITLGGNVSTAGAFTTSGAFGITLTATALTSVTLPTSGTLVNSAVTTLSSLASIGTVTTGTWNASTIGVAYGGTGATTLTGLVKGNGTSAFTAAVDGTDYLSPSATIDGGTF